MHSLDYRVAGAQSHLTLNGLPGHVALLARMVALVGGANYALPHGYPAEPVRVVVAVLALVGVVTPVIAAVRLARRRDETRVVAFACFWAASAVLLASAFVLTQNAASLGAGSYNYLLTLPAAAGVGVALLCPDSRRARVLAATAVALVGAVNLVEIADNRADTPRALIGTYERPLVHLLEQQHVTHGYAGYWDAQNLTWQSGMRVFAAPVATCGNDKSGLCAVHIFAIASWFEPKPGPSFLIVDPANGYVTAPPAITKSAAASFRFGGLRVYLFRYDIARRIHASVSL
jgi:hypothetical protein